MERPDLRLKEPPDLPSGDVEVFRLDGSYDFASPTSQQGTLRSAKILTQTKLTSNAVQQALALLHDLKLYGGNPARCFIPRHGFRFAEQGRSVDILICLECHWIYFFYGAKPLVASLSRSGREVLERFFSEVLERI